MRTQASARGAMTETMARVGLSISAIATFWVAAEADSTTVFVQMMGVGALLLHAAWPLPPLECKPATPEPTPTEEGGA